MRYCKEQADNILSLKKIIKKKDTFEEIKNLIINISKNGYFSKNKSDNTLPNSLSDSMKKEDFAFMRKGNKNATIVWNI